MAEERLFQFSESEAQDSYIVSTSVNSSYANNVLLKTGVDSSGSIARMIFKVSFGDIDPRVTLTKAELKLYCQYGATKGTYDFHKFTGNFSEIMTWSNQSSIESTPFFSLENHTFQSGNWYTINILKPCKEWINGTNNGFIMRTRSNVEYNSQASFLSSSYSDSWLRPQLYFEFEIGGKRIKNSMINFQGGALVC